MSLDVYLHDPTATYPTGALYSSNITHNLNRMADEAGIYEAIWRPEEIQAVYAQDIIALVEKGLSDLKERPEHYRQFDAPNGWGVYDDFIRFVSNYLEALKEYPKAKIGVYR